VATPRGRNVRAYPATVPAVEVYRHRRARKLPTGSYEVWNRAGTEKYVVSRDGDLCTCPARLNPCHHKAVVLRQVLREIRRSAA
jgi:hypothetical protein